MGRRTFSREFKVEAVRLVKEGGETLENKIEFGLKLVLSRQPTKKEINSLRELYESELAHYRASEKAATTLATSQLGALPEGLNAAEAAAWGIFFNQGEICNAASRLLVEEKIKDEFLAKVVEKSAKYMPGDPLDPGSVTGAIVSEAQQIVSAALAG